MATITISRQMGSFGYEVAQLTAEILGYRLVWRELINQAAQLAGAPEMALAAIDELGLLDICPSPRACRAYRQAVQQVMVKFADEGNVVIVGRAGQVILKDRSDVLHVRLTAPTDLRAQRIANRQGISIECAKEQVLTSDRFRAMYLRRFYQARWDDNELYHLVINTGKMTLEQAAHIICSSLSLLPPPTSQQTSPSQETRFGHTATS